MLAADRSASWIPRLVSSKYTRDLPPRSRPGMTLQLLTSPDPLSARSAGYSDPGPSVIRPWVAALTRRMTSWPYPGPWRSACNMAKRGALIMSLFLLK